LAIVEFELLFDPLEPNNCFLNAAIKYGDAGCAQGAHRWIAEKRATLPMAGAAWFDMYQSSSPAGSAG
jgi:hypothetical protein